MRKEDRFKICFLGKQLQLLSVMVLKRNGRNHLRFVLFYIRFLCQLRLYLCLLHLIYLYLSLGLCRSFSLLLFLLWFFRVWLMQFLLFFGFVFVHMKRIDGARCCLMRFIQLFKRSNENLCMHDAANNRKIRIQWKRNRECIISTVSHTASHHLYAQHVENQIVHHLCQRRHIVSRKVRMERVETDFTFNDFYQIFWVKRPLSHVHCHFGNNERWWNLFKFFAWLCALRW